MAVGDAMLQRYLLLLFCFSGFDVATIAHQPTVVVIGAGLAGLSAAHRLHVNGINVQVYEARPRPGGRTLTCYFDNGHYEELGGQNLNDGGEASTLSALINELGLDIETLFVGRDGMLYLDGNGNSLPYLSLIKNGPLPTDERYSSLYQKGTRDVSLDELLDDFFGANTLLRSFMEKRTSGFEGCATKKLSTYYFDSFWHYYRLTHELALSKNTAASTPYVMRTVKGGMCNLVQALCDNLDGHIQYNMPLRKIERSEKHSIILTFDDTTTIIADVIIIAIPCSTLRNISIQDGIIPPDQLAMINTLQYGTNAKILIPIQDDKQQIAHLGNNASILVCTKPVIWCYFGGENGIFDSSCATTLTAVLEKEKVHLNTFFPHAITNWQVQPVPPSNKAIVYAQGPVGISWINEEFSRGSYSALAPGQCAAYNQYSQYYDETVRTAFRPVGNIFFAGEHASLNNPSTMEGAVESGERTARMIMHRQELHQS